LPESWNDGVRLFTFDDLRDRLRTADLVICATDSPHFVLMTEHAPCFQAERPVILCDLTMPRNVDPALDGIEPNLRVIGLDDLKHWFRRELADMEQILDLSEQTVGAHMDLYERIIWNLGSGAPSYRAAAVPPAPETGRADVAFAERSGAFHMHTVGP
jgi:glutamyl-tRNA reductase